MSLQISGIGTTDKTYSNNWDRNGGWANYLSALSLQNNHDRQKVFGQANVRTGMVEINEVNKRTDNTTGKAGKPMQKRQVRYQNVKIAVPKREKEIASYKKKGYNPNYVIAPGSG